MAQKMSVSLEDKHVKIVERYGRKIGVAAFSTALQALIHNFDQAQKAAAAEPDPALADLRALRDARAAETPVAVTEGTAQ